MYPIYLHFDSLCSFTGNINYNKAVLLFLIPQSIKFIP